MHRAESQVAGCGDSAVARSKGDGLPAKYQGADRRSSVSRGGPPMTSQGTGVRPVTGGLRRYAKPLGSYSWFKKAINNYWYPFVTRRWDQDDVVFLNWGYEEDPPMRLPLSPDDEKNRYCIQLYHRTATQIDLGGKKVLELSCGHGGGAAFLMKTLCPASYTGLDFNPHGVEFAKRRHPLPGWTSCTATPKICRSPDDRRCGAQCRGFACLPALRPLPR